MEKIINERMENHADKVSSVLLNLNSLQMDNLIKLENNKQLNVTQKH